VKNLQMGKIYKGKSAQIGLKKKICHFKKIDFLEKKIFCLDFQLILVDFHTKSSPKAKNHIKKMIFGCWNGFFNANRPKITETPKKS